MRKVESIQDWKDQLEQNKVSVKQKVNSHLAKSMIEYLKIRK